MATNNRQVAHIWAQGNGATAQGSNFRCVDNRLYSYNTLVGIIHEGVCFLSYDNMTPTTAKQLSYAARACSYRCFRSSAFEYGYSGALAPEQLITAAAETHIEAFKALLRARKPDVGWYMNRRAEILEMATRFGVTIPDIPEATGDLKEKAQAYQKAEKARKAEAEKRERERRDAQKIIDKGELDLWLQYGRGRYPASFRERGNDQITIKDGRIGLELNPEASTVVTSQGAEAPLDHVRKAILFYKGRAITYRSTCTACGFVEYEPRRSDCRDTNCGNCKALAFGLQRHDWVYDAKNPMFKPYHTNGHKIPLGHFTLDEIDEQGNVKAGCHRFSAQEIARFIAQWREVLG